MHDTLVRNVDTLIIDAVRNCHIYAGLKQTMENRTRLEGIHSGCVEAAIKYRLTEDVLVHFPDKQGSHWSSEKLQYRPVPCFTELASKMLGARWRMGIELLPDAEKRHA